VNEKKKPPEGVCMACQRSWKEIIASGSEYGEYKDKEGVEYSYHSVGSGITKYKCECFKTEADWIKYSKSKSYAKMREVNIVDYEFREL